MPVLAQQLLPSCPRRLPQSTRRQRESLSDSSSLPSLMTSTSTVSIQPQWGAQDNGGLLGLDVNSTSLQPTVCLVCKQQADIQMSYEDGMIDQSMAESMYMAQHHIRPPVS
jgi:hypothetical protein